jgi:hypothetical protein
VFHGGASNADADGLGNRREHSWSKGDINRNFGKARVVSVNYGVDRLGAGGCRLFGGGIDAGLVLEV